MFDRVEVELDPDFYKGGKFTVEAKGNSPENIYIQSVSLNGKNLDRAWITHDEITSGGTLRFVMGPEPDKSFGSDNLPPSYGRDRWSVE